MEKDGPRIEVLLDFLGRLALGVLSLHQGLLL